MSKAKNGNVANSNVRRKYMSYVQACDYIGVCRNTMVDLAGRANAIIKLKTKVIIDMDVLENYISTFRVQNHETYKELAKKYMFPKE